MQPKYLLQIHYRRPPSSKPKRSQPKRRLVSMRHEKRPQTIMEAYRHREMMQEEHNKKQWEAERRHWQLMFDTEALNHKQALYLAMGI